MKHLLPLTSALLSLALAQAARAQHCPPIYQSFLSEIAVKWVDDSMHLRVEYTKEGGQAKKAYQAYVVAYIEKDSKLVPTPKGEVLLDPKATLVLHTQLIKRNAKGAYDLEYSIADTELVKRVVKHMKLGDKDRDERRYWNVYKDRIRIAVFIPFLDDKKYSTIEGLPKDRHECNYANERALIFQTLPYRLEFMTAHKEDMERRVWVRINGDKPRARD